MVIVDGLASARGGSRLRVIAPVQDPLAGQAHLARSLEPPAPPHPRPLPSRHWRRPLPVLAAHPHPRPAAPEDHAGLQRSLGPPSPSRSARCPPPAHPRVGRGDSILLCALIGKYGGAVKATKAAPALLPLPSRERVGVRVHRGAAFPPHPDPLPQWGRGNWSGTHFALFRNRARLPAASPPLTARRTPLPWTCSPAPCRAGCSGTDPSPARGTAAPSRAWPDSTGGSASG